MGTTFAKIKAGLDDAIAFAGGDLSRGRLWTPEEIKALRAQKRDDTESARAAVRKLGIKRHAKLPARRSADRQTPSR